MVKKNVQTQAIGLRVRWHRGRCEFFAVSFSNRALLRLFQRMKGFKNESTISLFLIFIKIC